MSNQSSHDGKFYNVYRTSVQFDLDTIAAILGKRDISKIVAYDFRLSPEKVAYRIYRRTIRFPVGRKKIGSKVKYLANLTLQAGDDGESF